MIINSENRKNLPLIDPSPRVDTSLFRVNNLEEANDLIAKHLCPHEIRIQDNEELLDVHFRGLMRQDMQLLNIGYGSHVDITATENENYYFSQSTLSGSTCIYRNHQMIPTRVGDTVIVSPHTQYKFNLPTGSNRLVIGIEQDIMSEYLESILEEQLTDRLVFDLDVPNQENLQIWVNHIINLSQTLTSQFSMATNRRLFQSQLESTMSLMLCLFEHNFSDDLRNTQDKTTPLRIKRAKDYIFENIKEPITVIDVAKAACVSPRALQYAFREEVGMSPVQYIKFQKLKAVHRALQMADPSQQVTAILSDHGVLSLGHFAKSYKEVYGKTPRETLKS